jgi:ribonuclease E
MSNKMLIDAAHPEETRVVVLRGNRVEEFDFESANRKQLRGNIYLAKVTRVEPSLQAAFVDYGGNRHGFLAFSEIHPDYYQIPVADRQALIAEEEERARREAEDEEHGGGHRRRGRGRHRRRGANRQRDVVQSQPVAGEGHPVDTRAGEAALGGLPPGEEIPHEHAEAELTADEQASAAAEVETQEDLPQQADPDAPDEAREAYEAPMGDVEPHAEHAHHDAEHGEPHPEGEHHEHHEGAEQPLAADAAQPSAEAEGVESTGGADALEEVQERLPRFRRQYKIQEVIKRRQVMLVQVVKEERGTKGAALTTYLSLAGRYSVLMPNTARGGGISRKITSAEDRARLKEIATELEVPEGMGVILRTAGASRTTQEVKRDFEYLMRVWEQVRDLTLKSTAPKLVYEEGSLIKRSIRDLFNKDVEDIVIAGEDGYREAKEFMHMLMPGAARQVKLYRDTQPVFTRYGIESQLDAMFTPVVQLRSGGYIVINQAEALVAIDVNSGRATREHHIEDTALKTNLEAADEVARQLRLRDLAGLIVIDFIDMDEGRNNRLVERRLKDALKFDRARIQVGRISHFGLLEMSRQRIRTSVLESSTEKCPICAGSGHVRSVSSVALQLLRTLEETLIKGATHNLIVRTRNEVALYVLNNKRGHLRGLEERFQINVTISADPTVVGQQSFIIDRGEMVHTPDAARAIAAALKPAEIESIEAEDEALPAEFQTEGEGAGEPTMGGEHVHEHAPGEPMHEHDPPQHREGQPREGGRRRRRRRGGRGRGRGRGRDGQPLHEGGQQPQQFNQPFGGNGGEHAVAHEDHDDGPLEGEPYAPDAPPQGGQPMGAEGGEREGGRRRRRRGRRGGRRNRRRNGEQDFQQQGGDNGGQNLGGQDFGSHENMGSGEPVHESRPFAPPPQNFTPEPPRQEPPAAPAEEQHAAEQRRRSTVRESANNPSSTLPPPKPVISSSSSSEDAPKRGGWWRRMTGDKE